MDNARIPTVYLGTHETSWLGWLGVPLFVSNRRLVKRKRFPRALESWALDSGGFSELNMFGAWRTSAKEYVAQARRYRDEIGMLDWAAIQDWMCEPFVRLKTGLSITEHQDRTVSSYIELMALAPDVPWAPVLQGWQCSDYLRCVELYDRRGVNIAECKIVGVGSVCRRQDTSEARSILRPLASLGIRLHGFGFKSDGLIRSGRWLVSSDSMAWSFRARRSPPLLGCAHKSCANCSRFALYWYARLRSALETRSRQLLLPALEGFA